MKDRLEYHREYYRKNRDKWRGYAAARDAAVKDDPERAARRKEYERRWYAENRERVIAKARRWRERNSEMEKFAHLCRRMEREALSRSDAAFYAWVRAQARARYAAKRVAEGKPYTPRPSRRIPDWARRGERVADCDSAYLPENLTPSARAFARDMAIMEREASR